LGPQAYGPDKTQNYELGIKSELLDHTVAIDVSAYYINWSNIQIQVENPAAPSGFAYMTNAGRAKSEGFEASLKWHPLPGLNIATWLAWNEAVITEGFPADSSAYGPAGSRLPYSSPWSGNISVDQQFQLARGWEAYVGATVSEVGNRVGDFSADAVTPRPVFAAYTQTDLRAGVTYNSWRAALYANNVADRRGEAGTPSVIGNLGVQYIRPRTIGLNVTKDFK
jgi:iron complex outermembrane receptor protein